MHSLMHSLLPAFAVSLIYAQVASATVVNLKSIFNSKATGTLTISEDKQLEVNYQLNVEDKDQAYAVLIFKDDDCKNFTKPVAVSVNDPKDPKKNIPFNSLGAQFLLFIPASKQTTLTGKAIAPLGSYFAFEPKGKSYVLMAIKDVKSDTGLARACGIHP